MDTTRFFKVCLAIFQHLYMKELKQIKLQDIVVQYFPSYKFNGFNGWLSTVPNYSNLISFQSCDWIIEFRTFKKNK